MNVTQLNNGRSFWLAWFLATLLGFGIGGILGATFAYPLFPAGRSEAASGIALGIVMGATGGYFQWMVLRERIAGAGLWGLASTLGFGSAIGAVIITDADENLAIASLLMAGVFGAASGVLQWLILRPKLPQAGWWLPANLLGSLVGAIAVPITGVILAAGHWEIGLLIFGLLFGTGYGAITGAVLIWLLRQSPSDHINSLTAVH